MSKSKPAHVAGLFFARCPDTPRGGGDWRILGGRSPRPAVDAIRPFRGNFLSRRAGQYQVGVDRTNGIARSRGTRDAHVQCRGGVLGPLCAELWKSCIPICLAQLASHAARHVTSRAASSRSAELTGKFRRRAYDAIACIRTQLSFGVRRPVSSSPPVSISRRQDAHTVANVGATVTRGK